jgi:hypothetical protein
MLSATYWLIGYLLSLVTLGKNRDDPDGCGARPYLSNRSDKSGDGRVPDLKCPALSAKLSDPAPPCLVRIGRLQCGHREQFHEIFCQYIVLLALTST